MPVETLTVDGKKYLYFYCYDRSVSRKIRVYIGPASEARSRSRASALERRYRAVQEVKDRLLLHVSRFTASQALGNSVDAATERMAVLKELENLAAAVEG
jgi:hypothetical protein